MNSRREKIFDEVGSDTLENLGEGEATTYHATLARTGKQWTATVRDLPGGRLVRVQGASWSEVKQNVVDCIFELLPTEPSVIALQALPADPEAAAALAAVSQARAGRVDAEQAEREAVRRAARLLIDKGWSTRDTGSALGLSHQRISQLVPRTTG
ncbi:hypothetical protein Skr01_74660 [Sphaerisporangium krabiense]|uniref:Uncharacterized protein n=1 Tax=Sphaerisporangium krabiense TaxID=763782 RepID=A0A7W8Z3L7_9ACTN|nr:hypothetical protein [Sphaerisporangium krabiense]MBB5626821.1 hypothetical protein [Sphaerisporangium krabiense]GII67381.1 hypothetical protein Skr01_74660 [Sphaerisporangium krabiense]